LKPGRGLGHIGPAGRTLGSDRRMTRRAAALALLLWSFSASTPLSSAPRLFSSSEPLALEIEAPFAALFAHIKQPNDSSTVEGTLTVSDAAGSKRIAGVQIGLRGTTSLRSGECAFPKLKLKFEHSRVPADSVFFAQTTLKVG